MKRIKFFTLGCKVNQYETQGMREILARAGLRESGEGEEPDVVVINTCSVTASADRKSRYLINRSRRLHPGARLIVTGCYAQLDYAELAGMPGVSCVIRNEDKARIAEVFGYSQGETGAGGRQGKEATAAFNLRTRAFLKIQDGCDNRCSYCKIPLMRGPSRSRSFEEVVEEAHTLVENGFKEIVVCGICLGAYGKDFDSGVNLSALLRRIEEAKGLVRIRLSSIEAGDVSEELIETVARSKKICPHFHIPMQSGDDRILQLMNRRYSRHDYLDVVKKVRKALPEAAITTDIIVGFPGEDEGSFNNTIDLVDTLKPSRTHIFPYSPRKGTAAYNFKGRVTDAAMKKRIARLARSADKWARDYQNKFLDREVYVLVEEKAAGDGYCWEGYSDNYIKVRVSHQQDLCNRLIRARIREIAGDYASADCILS